VKRTIRSSFDWFFRSRETGRITVMQLPNVALWIFIATAVLRRVVTGDSGVRTAIGVVGVAALAWWAVDEVVRGVNPWRRVFGLGVCVLVIRSVL
jgi:hypothetical protein